MTDPEKVIGVPAESDRRREDAAAQAVARAGPTVHNIRSICINNLEASIEHGTIVHHLMNSNISLLLD
ncbi:MAG: dodecin domain-containing protein [Gammaproteobacteria bacterium]|jgi:dodecin